MHIKDLQSICLPIGFERTACQPLACALTAHLNMVMGIQLHMLKKWWNRGEFLKIDSFLSEIIRTDSKTHLDEVVKTKRKGYYRIFDQWQGRFERLTVLGDCSPRTNTGVLSDRNYKSLLTFSKKVKLPLKFIFLVRNPYDIASSEVVTSYLPVKQEEKFDVILPELIRKSELGEKLLTKLATISEHSVFIWCLEDHIANPRKKLAELCDFLNIESEESYLDVLC